MENKKEENIFEIPIYYLRVTMDDLRIKGFKVQGFKVQQFKVQRFKVRDCPSTCPSTPLTSASSAHRREQLRSQKLKVAAQCLTLRDESGLKAQ